MSRRVLIVSPHFPPVNAPDMQRVRMALPHLRALRWEPVVLALAPEMIEGAVIEPLLLETFPADVRVVRVRGISPRLTRRLGVGNLWWRCGRAFTRAGDALLRAEKFDLVFFSNTQFSSFKLGPRWRSRFGVPFVLDYQDPWINPYYKRTGTRPPGGQVKFALSQFLARCIEPRALRAAAGVIAVSDAYGAMLHASYPWFDPERVHFLPFGASPADFVVAREHRPANPLIDFDDGNIHHVYTGRCGPDMSVALTALFRAFRRFLETHREKAHRVRFHFIGTGYAPPPLGREWVAPIAQAEGVREFVAEHCYRVPYFDALHYLSRAHAVVAVGSNDASYSASKIFPYILAERPLLLIYHRNSPVGEFAARTGAGQRFHFDHANDADEVATELHRSWFVEEGYTRAAALNSGAFAPFTARVLTEELVNIFNGALVSYQGDRVVSSS